MSISSLFQPNNYNLYCNSITTSNDSQSFRATNVPITLAGAGSPVITLYSVHGVQGPLPAVLSAVDYCVIASGVETVVHITIPFFDINGNTGTSVTSISLPLPPQLTPGSNISSGLAVMFSAGTSAVAQVVVTNGSTIQILPLNGGTFWTTAGPFFGLHNADFTITYTIPN